MTQAIKVYGVPFSVHTRKVIMAMRIKDIAHDVVPVAPIDPTTLPQRWKQLSPTGLIPVIDDAGFALGDSTAICLYLERKAPTPALFPDDARAFGRTLALDAWAGSELFRRVIHPLFHQQLVLPKLKGQPGDASAIDTALRIAAPEAFAFLEQAIDGASLANGALTIADLAVMSNLVMFRYLSHAIDDERYPKLARYFRAHVSSPLLSRVLSEERAMVARLGLDPNVLS